MHSAQHKRRRKSNTKLAIPIVAMYIYNKFNPESILYMTMGWKGRLVGACVLDIEKYTGIQINSN
jgi:hypothetical protein